MFDLYIKYCAKFPALEVIIISGTIQVSSKLNEVADDA